MRHGTNHRAVASQKGPDGEPFDLYLIAERKRFQALAGRRGDGPVMILREDHTLCYLNPSAQAFFRGFSTPLVGRHLFSVVHGKDAYNVMRALKRLTNNTERLSFLARLFTRRDRWRWFDATATRFSYRNGQRVAALFLQPLTITKQ